ncbi:hypothetical protein D3C72_2208400 [compost metagenome]
MALVGDEPGALEILDRVFQIGFGIEETGGRAVVAHRLGGRIFDLHEAVVAVVVGSRLVGAFAVDHAVDERFRHLVDRRIFLDQRVDHRRA